MTAAQDEGAQFGAVEDDLVGLAVQGRDQEVNGTHRRTGEVHPRRTQPPPEAADRAAGLDGGK